MKRLRVGILFGGRSAEHEVSILSARNIFLALDRERFDAVLIGIDKKGRWLPQADTQRLVDTRDVRLARLNESVPPVAIEPGKATEALVSASGAGAPEPPDVIFPVVHGPFGEDGATQGLLELAGLPYVGAGVLGSAVGMDKDVMKRLLREAGIPVARFHTIRAEDVARDAAGACSRVSELGFPLFTKPANLGSSVGIRRVARPEDLRDALAFALRFDTKVIAEEAITGREIEVAVLGNADPRASIPGEIRVQHADHGAALDIPAVLDAETTRRAQELAVRAFLALECSGMARVDFFLRSSGELLVNEINTLPGFTAISMYPKLWEASGVPPRELITRLIELALERHAARRALQAGAPEVESADKHS
jgi:D-alanine-D-alanine ligase